MKPKEFKQQRLKAISKANPIWHPGALIYPHYSRLNGIHGYIIYDENSPTGLSDAVAALDKMDKEAEIRLKYKAYTDSIFWYNQKLFVKNKPILEFEDWKIINNL